MTPPKIFSLDLKTIEGATAKTLFKPPYKAHFIAEKFFLYECFALKEIKCGLKLIEKQQMNY